MGHFLYLIFRCDFDVMKNLENLEEFGGVNTAREKKVEERSELGRGDFRPNGPRPSAFLHVLGPGGLDFGC